MWGVNDPEWTAGDCSKDPINSQGCGVTSLREPRTSRVRSHVLAALDLRVRCGSTAIMVSAKTLAGTSTTTEPETGVIH
jgi:hypothetical protein